MLPTIEFDDEHRFDTGEIRDERADRSLSAKLQPFQSTISHMKPELLLGIALISS